MSRGTARVSAAGRRSPGLHQASRLAVLPFTPLGADEEGEYAGLAMADSLITKLSGVRRLVPRPTRAVSRYMGAGRDPFAAGRELRVDAVLTGTLQRAGGRVRVNVQLTDVEGESLLWAGSFDEPFTDVFALQDVISERVAAALLARLGAEERERLRRHHTQDPEAYRAYARGLYHMNRYTPDGLRKAAENFSLAAEMSPAYALAQVGLAQTFQISAGWTEPPGEALRASALAARRALGADDSLAEAHALAAAGKFWGLSDVESAEAGFLRALELDPNSVAARHWYGWFLTATGRFDEAEREPRAAAGLDPLSLPLNADLGLPHYEAAAVYATLGESERALELIGRAYVERDKWLRWLEIDPRFADLPHERRLTLSGVSDRSG